MIVKLLTEHHLEFLGLKRRLQRLIRVSLGSSLIIFSSFLFFRSLVKNDSLGISIDSATWIFPQILSGKDKNDNPIG